VYFDKSYKRARHERRELSVMLSIRIQTVSVSKLEELVKCKLLVHKLKVTHDVELVHSGYTAAAISEEEEVALRSCMNKSTVSRNMRV